MRRGNKRAVNGIIFLDKPIGMSSNQALQKVRWLYQAEKAGHGGTLDPFAEGALPILLGDATKFGQYYLLGNKEYRVTMQFGCETTTDDSEGEITVEKAIPDLNLLDWTEICQQFLGKQMQMPPIYSALKVNGRKSYELARSGKKVTLEAREIEIHSLNLVTINHENQRVTLDVSCGKGTYIRALVRDIARYCNSAAHAVFLRRLQIGDQKHSLYQLDDLERMKVEGKSLDHLLLPVTECVQSLPKLDVPSNKFIYIRNGNDIEIDAIDGEYALYENQIFFGVGTVNNQRLYPKRLCKI